MDDQLLEVLNINIIVSDDLFIFVYRFDRACADFFLYIFLQ